jgi:oligoribonuclease NrnB/cAMP/cGMP phosphodiesterase (DHH superfamily)
MNSMNYILYHANCNDGFGAAFAAWLYFGKKLDTGTVYLPVSYGKPMPDMQPGCDVYIVDFSYPAKDLLALAARQNKVVVLDHHVTAQKDLSIDAFCQALPVNKADLIADASTPPDGFDHVQNIAIRFDMSKSGAVLAWEYFFPEEPVPLLLQYIQDRDLWRFKMNNSRAVSAYLQTCDMDFNVWGRVAREMTRTADMQEIYRAGAACLKLKEQMVDSMAEHGFLALFDMNTVPPILTRATSPQCFEGQFIVPVANATCFFSEVGERLLQLHPDVKFSAYYLDREDGKRQWGMRSRPDFDCSVIAKAFGGGGHPGAAGFTMDMPW